MVLWSVLCQLSKIWHKNEERQQTLTEYWSVQPVAQAGIYPVWLDLQKLGCCCEHFNCSVLEPSEWHWCQGLLQAPPSAWMLPLWAASIQGAYSHSFEVETWPLLGIDQIILIIRIEIKVSLLHSCLNCPFCSFCTSLCKTETDQKKRKKIKKSKFW